MVRMFHLIYTGPQDVQEDMLARFFKPNWQHTKPEKRIKAIAKLRAADIKAQSILSQLALADQDELVRLSATEKLSNLNILITISKQESSSSVLQQALHKISQILLDQDSSSSIDEKKVALSALSDSNLLTHIALNSGEEALRTQAIEQLADCESLAIIAEKSQRAGTRVQATEKISDPEILEQLSKKARGKDKGVFKVVREKLQLIREQDKRYQEDQLAISKLIAAVAQLSKTAYFPLYAAKLKALENDWNSYLDSASTEQQDNYNQLFTSCQDILDLQKAREAEEQQKAAIIKSHKDRSHELYSELCVLKESCINQDVTPESVDSLQNKLTELTAPWADVKSYASKDEQKNFEKLADQLKNFISASLFLFTNTNKFEDLAQALSDSGSKPEALTRPIKEATELLNKLSWPKQHTKTTALLSLEESLAVAQSKLESQNSHTKQLQKELSDLLDNLKSQLKAGEIRSADKHIKKAEQLSKRLNGHLTLELEQRIKSLGAELKEIRDWQAYAVTPKKEALCEQMEALCHSDLPVQERANHIRKIQKEWKVLDATDSVHSQQLWKRFKNASDTAYAPCDEFFAEQRDLRQSNLKQRQRICDELRSLTQPASDASSDTWKQYEESIRSAKHAWRNYAPVDRAPGKKIQVEFDSLLKTLDAPLKEQRQENANLKLALIKATEDLLNSGDLEGATDKIKALQKDWKAVGPAPKNQERKLWNQFRDNCSAVFDAFFASKPGHRNNTPVTGASQLGQLCEELELALENTSSLSDTEEKLSEAFRLLENTSTDQAFSVRLEKISDIIEQQKLALKQFESEAYQSLHRKAEICEQLEHAILSNEVDDNYNAIKQAWLEAESESRSPVDIENRFSTLIQLIEKPELMNEVLNQQELRLRKLCIRLEIATSNPSPIEDQALRMEYQMERLQQALAEQQQGFTLSEVKQLEYEWLCVPFAANFENLNERFEEQLQEIL